MPSPPLHQLCDVCRNIRFDVKSINPEHKRGSTDIFNHHRNLFELAKSARSCHLCTLFLAAIRIRIDPSGVRDNWIPTTDSDHATTTIQLAYSKDKDEEYAQIQVNFYGGYTFLTLADSPQFRCSSGRRATVHADLDSDKLLGRIPPKPLPQNYNFHYSAVANCRAEGCNLELEDIPDLSVWDTFFVHEAGWV